jgi:hypothetical protein
MCSSTGYYYATIVEVHKKSCTIRWFDGVSTIVIFEGFPPKKNDFVFVLVVVTSVTCFYYNFVLLLLLFVNQNIGVGFIGSMFVTYTDLRTGRTRDNPKREH